MGLLMHRCILLLCLIVFSENIFAAPCSATITQGMTESCDSISQYGITWTLSSNESVGQYWNGDYFIVDDGSVTVSSVSPAWDGSKNGTEKNPSAGDAHEQGLDSRAAGYAASKRATYPISMSGGDALVSADGNSDPDTYRTRWDGVTNESRGFIDTAAVLTVVSSQPASNTFRPSPTDRSQTTRTVSQVNTSLLPDLDTTGMTATAYASGFANASEYFERGLARPWVLFGCDFYGRDIHPRLNMYGYHQQVGDFLSEVLTYVISDRVNTAIVNSYIQVAIDMYGATADYTNGFCVDSSIFAQVVPLAGLLLGDTTMRDIWINHTSWKDQRGQEKFYFPSQRHPSYTTCWTGWNYASYGYSECPMFSKQTGQEFEYMHPSGWTCYEPHCKGEVYREQHDVYPQVGLSLPYIVLGEMPLVRAPALFAYMYRWMSEPFMTGEYDSTGRTYYEEFQYYKPTTIYLHRQQHGSSDFADDMWAAYNDYTPVEDTEPPTNPSNLTATANAIGGIDLSWTASTDNVGVSRYEIERCSGTSCSSFAYVTTVTETSYNDSGLTASTSYSYRVRAFDGADNSSGYSNMATDTTIGADTEAPTAPTNLVATAVSSTQVDLTWTASTDDRGVAHYIVERCTGAGCSSFSSIATPDTTSHSDISGLTGSTTYRYRIKAEDYAGNTSDPSSEQSVTTLAVSLANGTTHSADSGNFDVTRPVSLLWDGEIQDPTGFAGTDTSDTFWVEFDLGQTYNLSLARLFGDTGGTWISTLWSLEYKLNSGGIYTAAFTNQDAYLDDWVTESLTGISARYIKVTVVGSVDNGTVQAREFELYGTPASLVVYAPIIIH